MGVKAKRWEFYTEYHKNALSKNLLLPGMDFSRLFKELQAYNIAHLKITVEEVIDWNMAPMRGFFHGIQLPAFTHKFNETCKHPSGHFGKETVKGFLKAKFLGWDKTSTHYEKWKKILNLNIPVGDMESYLAIQHFNSTLNPPIGLNHTKDLTPEEYMVFINNNEKLYLELFQEMYDKRSKPELKGDSV